MFTEKRSFVRRLLYPAPGLRRPVCIPIWWFYVTAPLYAIHWYFLQGCYRKSPRKAVRELVDNFLVIQSSVRFANQNLDLCREKKER